MKKNYKNEEDSEGSDIASDDSVPDLEHYEGGVADRKKSSKASNKTKTVKAL